MKAHIGVDADSGLVHTVTTTAANEADVEQVEELLHGKEEVVHADAGYTGAQTRIERQGVRWEIAAKRGRIKAMKDGLARRRARANRETQGKHPGEGRASVPSDQAAVRPNEGALPRAGEEHGARDHAVRVVESVDGTTTVIGDDGSTASTVREMRETCHLKPCTRFEIGDPVSFYPLQQYK